MAQISYDTLTITNIPDNLRQNFWVETTSYSSQIPAGVYITQNSASSFKNNPSGPNIFMQAVNNNNGIRLRQGLLTLAEIMSDRFRLYTPNGSTQGLLGLSLDATDGLVLYKNRQDVLRVEEKEGTYPHPMYVSDQDAFLSQVNNTIGEYTFIYHSTNGGWFEYNGEEVDLENDYGILRGYNEEGAGTEANGQYFIIEVYRTEVTEKGLQLSSTALKIFGSSQENADVTVNNNGIEIVKGGIKGGTPGSTTNRFVYLSTEDYGTGLVINNSAEKTDWRLVVGGQFGVDHYGRMWALGAHINGEIRSTTGTIGGWTLGTNKLYNGNIGDNNSASLATDNLLGTVAGKTFTSSDTATTGWRLTVGSNFGVDNTGKIYATSAEISGKITATSGTIGAATNSANKINIGTSTTYASIYSGSHSSLNSATSGFYIGADGISIGSTSGSNYFKVTSSGQITATGLTITGYATTSDNEDAKKVATDFLAKSGSSITLKTGWSSDYMTMTGDGTRIYCNSKALASFTTSGATIQAQNENDKINLSSSGLKVYKGGSLVAEFGDTINLQSSYGDLLISSTGVNLQSSYGNLLISSTGVNLNTSGSGTETFTFNNKPLLLVKGVTYKLPNALAASGASAIWNIRQALPADITDNYTVLGIIGYDFNNTTSTQAGISNMNVFECGLPLAYKGTRINFSARNVGGYTIAKGLISVVIYLLVSPKVSDYTPDGIDVGYSDTISGGE